MKHFLILILTIIVTSCCGTKKVIEKKPVEKEEIAIVTEIPDVVEVLSTPEPPKPPTSEFKNDNQKIETEVGIEKTVIPLPPKPPKRSSNYKELMHNRWNTILQKYVSENGNVNYKAIKKNRTELDIYIDYLSDTLPDNTWSKDEKLAYWINTYNALTIDLILRNHPTKSIKDIKDPWDRRLWKFGKKWYNLNDIEHTILRKMNEPRIHFAIVCASVSCPKLQNEAFTVSNLEEQLTNVTKEFLADRSKNELSKDRIKLSKIFKWFKKDFEKNGSLIDFLNQYSDVSISSGAKKSFKDYNWDLNN